MYFCILGKYCGTVVPGPRTMNGTHFVVEFNSDTSDHFAGFRLNFNATVCIIEIFPILFVCYRRAVNANIVYMLMRKRGVNKDQTWFASVHRIYQTLTPHQHQLLLPIQMFIAVLGGVQIGSCFSNSYTMGCPLVRGDNPGALASGLSYVQVDKHGITIFITPTSHQVIFHAKVGEGGIIDLIRRV